MNRVFLIKDHLLNKLRLAVREELRGRFNEGERICIKLHMGEYGNLHYIRPSIVELVVDELKQIGARPFLFDSPTVYRGSRESVEKYIETARKNGFSEQTMGCPVVISNQGVRVESKIFSQVELSKEVIEADGLVAISHFKGHEQTSFGGAIKNIGMGCVTKQTKGVMHTETQVVVAEIERCVGCGACVAGCPEEAISLENNKVKINYESCFGCCACALVLCQHGVLKPKTVALGEGLVEVASFILKKFKEHKTLFVNALMDITDYCDCLPIGEADVGKVIVSDVGMLVGDDILAIDKASLDLVEQASGGSFGKRWPADKDWQVEAGEKYGLGSGEYKLVEV